MKNKKKIYIKRAVIKNKYNWHFDKFGRIIKTIDFMNGKCIDTFYVDNFCINIYLDGEGYKEIEIYDLLDDSPIRRIVYEISSDGTFTKIRYNKSGYMVSQSTSHGDWQIWSYNNDGSVVNYKESDPGDERFITSYIPGYGYIKIDSYKCIRHIMYNQYEKINNVYFSYTNNHRFVLISDSNNNVKLIVRPSIGGDSQITVLSVSSDCTIIKNEYNPKEFLNSIYGTNNINNVKE